MPFLRFARILAATLPLATGALLHAPLAAQTILLRGGATPRLQVAPASKVAVPIVLDMSAAGGSNLASLTTGITFGAARLRFDSLSNGPFGSVTLNSNNASTGALGLSVFNAQGTTTTVTLATAWFTAATASGGTTVAFTPTVAGSDVGASLLALLRVRNLDVCVAPTGRWGDVNGDGVTNILDAQQIARFSVGFGVVSQTLLASQGDVTGDGAVNIIDAQQIARFTVGLSAAALVNTPRFIPPAIASVSLAGVPTSVLAVGASAQVVATPLDANGTAQNGCVGTTWTTSDAAIARVDSAGTVVGVASGTATITATAGGTSASFSITVRAAGVASVMSLVSGGGQSGAISAALPQPVMIQVLDAFNRGVAGVTVSVAVTGGGGSVTPASGTTNASGQFTTTWTLGATVGAQTLDVTSPNLPTVSVTATGTSATLTWVFNFPPGTTQVAGTAVTPAIAAELRNANNVVVSTYTGTATLTLGANPGGATLSGTTTATAANGVARFSNITLDKAGTGYTLVVSSTGATSATSSAFNVGATAAATLALQSGDAQTGIYGTTLSAPLTVKVTDRFGNAVAGSTVTFAIASGGGTVGTPSASTDANGVASSTWTLGQSGPQTVTIASTGLAGSPITASANTGAGLIAQTIVSPHADTLTALGATRQLSVQGRDGTSTVVSGTWTWVSRNTATATVNSAGLVTAVADGTVFVVVTEAGGTKDSVQIVVQQRIATVSVTPGSRTLYAGAGFTFTAQAVDGRGNAMATQPSFVWSSTVPSVLTINASGVASALTIGSTQVRATSGTAVGVSNVSVLTPITRIDVTVDSTNAPAPDNFTMTSLGQLRTYRAIARDTLLNPMTGVTFTWTSTNPSVAALDLSTAATTRATSAANGITSIQAGAQGVLGTATLNVAQVLASVELTPATATVAISGTTSMLARGKDANNRYISGGSFTYASAAASIATVGATTGLVTGVTNGSANITAASGAITSNTAVITVSSSGPAVISFGRDTIGVGRGTALSVPILLSKPNAAPVTVNLAVADTFAFWSAATVTIPAGATSANATLNGRNAGTTRITALDGSSTGYAGDTAVVAVQANLRMSTTYYGVTATDQVNTQVVLSDPSPAGGTYVTFTFGTAGRVTVSPDPAFIPAGQLAADVVIRGVAAGSTTITPSAVGVTGAAANMNVAAAVLSLSNSVVRLGAGQFDQYQYVYVPNYLTNPLTVGLASTNSGVASAPPSVGIPAGRNYVYWTINAVAPGSATINATATGWASASVSVVSTTPALRLCCGNTLNTTSPAQNLTIYSADSTRNTHPRTSSLAVRVTSSDSTVIRVLDTAVTILAGSSYNNSARVIPGGIGGTAWIRTTASGHTADSVQYTVNGPALALSYSTRVIGAGQVETGQYVYIPNAIASALVVRLANSDTTKGATDSIVTIPAGSNYAYFDIRGRSVGTSTITATATGYTSAAATNIVSTPRLRLNSGSLNAYSTTSTQIYVTDSLGSAHNRLASLTVTLRSSDSTKLKIDTLVVIPAGYYYVPSGLHITAVDTGTVKIYASAPGQATDSSTWTVNPVNIRMSFRNYRIGARQHRNPNDFYVYTPDSRNVAVPVTLTQRHAGTVALTTTTPTIAAGTNYAYFSLAGLVAGGDTIIATAVGYRPDTSFITVTRPEFRVNSLPGTATTTNAPATLTIYVTDSVGSAHYASDTVVIHAVSSNPNVIQPSQAYIRIAKNQYYTNPVVQYIGVGSATMTYSDSANSGYPSVTTNAVTVTGPSLALSSGAVMLGTGQNTGSYGMYVYTPDNVGTALTVRLASTDVRVATVPDSLIIPAGRNYTYFTISAADTIGTVQVQATATGYAATSMTTQVTVPRLVLSINTQLNTTSPPSAFYVYAQDANGSSHYVNQPLAVTLASSAPGVAAIDSTTVTIPVGQSYTSVPRWSPVSVGTAQLSARDTRAIRYPYAAATANVSVVLPTIYFSFGSVSLGIGQYQNPYVYVSDVVTGSPLTITLSHVAAASSSVPATVVIPVGTNYVYFRLTATGTGSDTITASATGFNGARSVVEAAPGRIDPLSGWPASLRAGDSSQVYLYTRSPSTSSNYVAAATTFTLTSNANIQFVSGGASSAVITSAVVAADGYYTTFWVKAVSAGTGTVSITNANYSIYTNSLSVTP